MLVRVRCSVVWALAMGLVAFGSAQTPAQNDAPQQEAEEPVYDPGNGVTPPRVVRQVNPKYDGGARGFRLSGAVLIGLVVSSRGLPVNVHVVRSLDKDVDESAVEAVREWRFDPGRKDGKPVAVRVTIEIRFHDL